MGTLRPAASAQADILTMERYIGGGAAVITGSILYPAETKPDEEIIRRTISEIIEANDALRIKTVFLDNRFYQEICEHADTDLLFLRFNSFEDFKQYAESKAQEPLQEGSSLFEVSVVLLPEEWGFLIRIHHLIGDAWTLSLLCRQINTLLFGDGTIKAYSYLDYLDKQNAYEHSGRFTKDISYFLSEYENSETIALEEIGNQNDYHTERESFQLDTHIVEALLQSARESGVSLYAYLMTIISAYISKIEMNISDFLIGTTLLNRYGEQDRNTAGLFVNTVPVRIRLSQEASLADNLQKVHETLTGLMRHSHCTYNHILRTARKNGDEVKRLFDISVNYQNAVIDAGESHPFRTIWFTNGKQDEALTIHIEDRDQENLLRLHFDYRTAFFTKEQIQDMYRRLSILIHRAVISPGTKLCDLSILTGEETSWLTHQSVSRPWPFIPLNLGSWFRRLAKQTPDQIILSASDGSYTWKEVDELSERACSALLANGVHQGSVVGLCLSRKSALPIMIMAAVKAGAVFVLTEPDYPPERIRYLISDADISLMVDDKLAEEFIHSDHVAVNAEEPCPDSLCYIIYTSGSTGAPKGVQITQRNLINNIFWRLHAYSDRDCRIINVTSVAADTFIEDLFYALYSGNCFCLVEDRKNIDAIQSMMAGDRKNDLMTTPTFFNLISKYISFERFNNVTLVGEYLEEDFAEEILSHGVRLHNEYGPSECTVCATHVVVGVNDGSHIGRPIDNTCIYILDSFLNPVPVKVKGEICIGGMPVGAGYLGMPEANKKRFIEHPLYGRIYRTGDIGYWREDGNIVICGRTDNQIKLRGQRIELYEIETQINRIPEVEQSAVIVSKMQEAGGEVLCVYYTGTETEEGIKDALQKHLPYYMIPQIYIRLQSMPMTDSGKINRKKLPPVGASRTASGSSRMAPRTAEEKILCDIAGELLGIPDADLNTHFFRVGGDSLKAIEFVSRVNQAGIPCKLQMVFDNPLLGDLARRLFGSNAHVQYSPQDLEPALNALKAHPAPHGRITGRETGNVLITGATGFFGVHILAEFLNNYPGEAWCIVRGKNNEDAVRRLSEKLASYHGEAFISKYRDRIHVLKGDLAEEYLGLNRTDYDSLRSSVSTVIHTAGNVKHFGPYQQFYRANVLSSCQLIEFCRHGAMLMHISTTSILCASNCSKPCDEWSFYHGQNLDNVYLHSKFEAERQVLEAVGSGMQGHIIRVGNLTNRWSDFVFQENYASNAFFSRIRSMVCSGIIPDELRKIAVDFTPVDLAAKACLILCGIDENAGIVFHLLNDHKTTIEEIADSIKASGYPVKYVSGSEFVRRENPAGSTGYNAFVNDFDEKGRLLLYEEHTDSTYTKSILQKHSFKWPETDSRYLKGYLDYFRKKGLFNL